MEEEENVILLLVEYQKLIQNFLLLINSQRLVLEFINLETDQFI